MYKKIFLLAFLLFFSLTNAIGLLAQEIPVLKDVQIIANVKYDTTDQIFTYIYAVTNPSSNTVGVTNIRIDISKSAEGKDLTPEGLDISHGVSPKGRVLIRSFKEEISRLGSLLEKPVIPVGTKTPDNWSSRISVVGTINFGSNKKEYDIMPGNFIKGFEVISEGLPSIRSVEISPFWVLIVEDVSEEDIEKSKQIEEQITFKTKTLGPTAPPADFKPIEFIDYIINLKHEAFSLGWIKNKGIENSLDAKLENAKKKLEQGNTNAAKNILNAFLNELEVQKDKHLTTEAYGLLKYNVEYLKGRL